MVKKQAFKGYIILCIENDNKDPRLCQTITNGELNVYRTCKS